MITINENPGAALTVCRAYVVRWVTGCLNDLEDGAADIDRIS